MSRGYGVISLAASLGGGERYVDVVAVENDVRTGDVLPGRSYTLRVVHQVSGATPPGAPNSVTITAKDGTGAALASFTLPVSGGTVPTGSTDRTVYVKTSPLTSTSGDAAGTLEWDVRMTRTDAVGPYDVSSDSRGTQNLGGHTPTRDRHWVRANTTAVLRAGKGAGAAAPAQDLLVFGESPVTRVAFGHPVYRAPSGASLELRRTDTNATIGGLASADWATTTAQSLESTRNVVDSGYPKQRVSTTVALGLPGHGASSQPVMVPTSTTVEYAPDVDPRLTIQTVKQDNDNSLPNPPSDALATNSSVRLQSALSFLWARVLNARGEGHNGLSLTRHLYDADQLVSTPGAGVANHTGATATLNGEPGWISTAIAWDEGLPGGTWYVRHTSSTSGTTGLLDPVDAPLTLISADPSLALICAAGPDGANADRHFTPGYPLLIGSACMNVSTLRGVVMDEGSPGAVVARLNTTLGRAEYLAEDLTWQPLTTTADAYAWPLTASPGSPIVYTRTFSAEQTATWSVADVFVIGRGTVGGVPVQAFQKELAVKDVNNHDAHEFDALALLGLGGFR